MFLWLLKKLKQIISLVVSHNRRLSLHLFILKTLLLHIKNLIFIALVMQYVLPSIVIPSQKIVIEITQGETSETGEILENEDAAEKETSFVWSKTGVNILYVAIIRIKTLTDAVISPTVRQLTPPPKA